MILLATQFKVVAVTGPRQSGKTTLVRKLTNSEGAFLVYGGDMVQNRSNSIRVVPLTQLNLIEL